MQIKLMNGQEVEASQEEVEEFITQVLTNFPYWKYSKLLTESEVMSFLKRESTEDELKKVARYLLIFIENFSFTGYLSDKSEGKFGMTKELNMPVVIKLRTIYQRMCEENRTLEELYGDVHEMENACMEIGADTL
jgi:hypothetical protein